MKFRCNEVKGVYECIVNDKVVEMASFLCIESNPNYLEMWKQLCINNPAELTIGTKAMSDKKYFDALCIKKQKEREKRKEEHEAQPKGILEYIFGK